MENEVAFALAESFEVEGILMVPQVRFLGLFDPVCSYAIPGAPCEIGEHWGSTWYNQATSLHMMPALAEKAGVKFRVGTMEEQLAEYYTNPFQRVNVRRKPPS